jgi:4-hydroxy-tetrahydrodipicolinate reductase
MGSRVVRLLEQHQELQLAGTVDRNDDAAAAIANAQVVIDFAAPATCASVAPLCVKAGAAYIMASTALTPSDEKALADAATHIPLLQAANFSVGVNVLAELVTAAAERLAGFDIEISEIHHKMKRDAPSGTALMLGEAAHEGRASMRDVMNRSGQRLTDELGYSAVRGGDVSGEHTVFFFGHGERLELTHRATTPDIFANGALTAAAWIVGKPAGRYSMHDVLRG